MNNNWLYHLLLVFLISGCFICTKQTFCCAVTDREDSSVIAFDLHGVVLKYDWLKVVPTIMSFDQKWSLIKNLYKIPFRQLWGMVYNRPSFEQFLQIVSSDNAPLHNLLIELSVQQKVVPEVEQLIEKLHGRGCTLHVVSNIGVESFRRLKIQFFDLFKLFSLVVTSDVLDHQGQLIKKPDFAYFEKYLQQIETKPSNVLFIDDRADNVAAARAFGMQAIQFKSAEQLFDELRIRGLISSNRVNH